MEQCIVASDEPVVYCIEQTLRSYLKRGKTLLLLSGGSAAGVAVQSLSDLRADMASQLLVGQIDERFGPVGHPYSNWKQILHHGLNCHRIPCKPILKGTNWHDTAEEYNQFLEEVVSERSMPIIGIFGVGTDGHTAGILPHSHAARAEDRMVTAYVGRDFDRITVTPRFIRNVETAIVYAKGDEKSHVLRQLHQDVTPEHQPVQFLKRAGNLTVFHNYT